MLLWERKFSASCSGTYSVHIVCPETLFLKIYPEEYIKSVRKDLPLNAFTVTAFVKEKCQQTKC